MSLLQPVWQDFFSGDEGTDPTFWQAWRAAYFDSRANAERFWADPRYSLLWVRCARYLDPFAPLSRWWHSTAVTRLHRHLHDEDAHIQELARQALLYLPPLPA